MVQWLEFQFFFFFFFLVWMSYQQPAGFGSTNNPFPFEGLPNPWGFGMRCRYESFGCLSLQLFFIRLSSNYLPGAHGSFPFLRLIPYIPFAAIPGGISTGARDDTVFDANDWTRSDRHTKSNSNKDGIRSGLVQHWVSCLKPLSFCLLYCAGESEHAGFGVNSVDRRCSSVRGWFCRLWLFPFLLLICLRLLLLFGSFDRRCWWKTVFVCFSSLILGFYRLARYVDRFVFLLLAVLSVTFDSHAFGFACSALLLKKEKLDIYLSDWLIDLALF